MANSDLRGGPGTAYAGTMAAEFLEEILSAQGDRRALIKQASDGRFLIEVEQRVSGDGIYEPRSYWSRVRQPVTVTDTLENARRLAAEAVGRTEGTGSV